MGRFRSRVWRFGAIGLTLVALALGALVYLHVNSQGTRASGIGFGCYSTTQAPACHYSGDIAQASFDGSLDSTGTTLTAGSVTIIQSVSHDPGAGTSTSSVVFANIYKENVQTGETLLDAYGDSALPQTFTVAGSLESASLNMTLPMYDNISGATLNVTFNVTWKGVGATTKMIDSSHFRSPSFVFMAHSVGYNRMAIASGTISDGTTNYASGVTTDASLDSSKGGTLYFGGN